MKTLTIGGKDFRLIENSKEISAIRYLEFNLYQTSLRFAGADADDMLRHIDSYVKGFNDDKRSDCLIYLHNLRSGLQTLTKRENPAHFMFALIVLEVGETDDPASLSKSHLQEKLNRLYALGLTQGEVEDTVLNFIHASLENLHTDLKAISVRQQVLAKPN